MAKSYKAMGDDFEKQVALALENLGYNVERNCLLAGSQIDLVATRPLELEDRIYIVECKYYFDTISVKQVREFSALINSIKSNIPTCAGLFIAEKSFSKEAKEFASSVGIILKTLKDVTEASFDTDLVAQMAIDDFNEIDASRIYVDLSCQTGEHSEGTIYKPVEKFLDSFLPTTQYDGCAILGNFGSGKTSLSFSYAAKHASNWLRGDHRFLPVTIRLRDMESFTNFRARILDNINSKSNLSVSDKRFQSALNHIPFLFIFDGLDEVAIRWDDVTLKDNMSRLKTFINSAKLSKFIITCRTHYFRSNIDASILSNFKHLYIRSWGADELKEYVQKSRPLKHELTLRLIHSIYNLEELSKTPIFLKMISETIDVIGDEVDHAQLYQVYTDKWINEQASRSSLSPVQKRKFMEELAFYMSRTGTMYVSYHNDIPSLIASHFKTNNDYTLTNRIDADIRTCSFLVRNEQGDYYFVHKSYMEFFVGSGLASDIQQGNLLRLSWRDYGIEVGGFISCYFKNDWKTIAKLVRTSSDINIILNCLSIAMNLRPETLFVEILVACLHSEENIKITKRICECLSVWSTPKCLETLIDYALDDSSEHQETAVNLLRPHLNSDEVVNSVIKLLNPSRKPAVICALIDAATQCTNPLLHNSVVQFMSMDFWHNEKSIVMSILQFIDLAGDSKLVENNIFILDIAEKLDYVLTRKIAASLYFRAKGLIEKEIGRLIKAGKSYQAIEGTLRNKYKTLIQDNDISDLIRNIQRYTIKSTTKQRRKNDAQDRDLFN